MLAATPGGLSQSEIARRLGTTPATCYPMLAALERAGWLRRHPTRRTYALGPGLIAAGQAAAAGTDALAAARGPAADLHRRLGLSVIALVPAAEYATVAFLVVDPHAARPVATLRVGDRVPFHPPLGITVMAWAAQPAVEAWLDRGGVAEPAERAEYRELIAAIRRRGYSVELSTSLDERVRRQVGEAAAANLRAELPALLRDLAERLPGPADFIAGELDAAAYRVDSVSAPVFDSHGDVALVLLLRGFTDPVPGVEIERLGGALTATTDAVTAEIAGRRPGALPAV
ncbi:MAG: helix-turn-helix domain-containing protein [Frankia sp.]|nr:helix-turn-helix domain-containing protein [Frankia sp.]